jgi:hypothetical protein
MARLLPTVGSVSCMRLAGRFDRGSGGAHCLDDRGERGGVGAGAFHGSRVGAGVLVEPRPELCAAGVDQIGTEAGDELAAFGDQRVGLGAESVRVESGWRWSAGNQGRQQPGLGGGESPPGRDGVDRGGYGRPVLVPATRRMAARSAARSASLG